MSTLTLKPKQVKESRPKRPLAPLAMQEAMYRPPAESGKRKAAESPDATGTSTPAGIVTNDPEAAAAAKEVRNFGGKSTSKILLKSCIRHPKNRVPTKEDVDARAASIQVDGLLEKPVVRMIGLDKYQIVSGETRILAMRQLGWHECDMELLTKCDDARALELLAIYNAQRKDLNPVEKARMIQELCRPKDEDGGGLTREAAAKIYGLESHSAASNLVRLLELPAKWQDRVAAGELPESWARALLPIVRAPRLLDVLDESWKQHQAEKCCELCSSVEACWGSREQVENAVGEVLEDYTRPIGNGKFRYTSRHIKGANCWDYTGEYPQLFTLTPELERSLEIVEIEWQKKKLRVSTNPKLYDKLQIPAIKQTVDARKKTSAEKAGRDAPLPKRTLTAAEKREAAAAKTRQLSERIAAWRHKLLRRACSQAVEDEQDSGLRLVLAHAAERCVPHGGLNFTEALLEVRKVPPRTRGYHAEYWPVVAGIDDCLASTRDEDHEGTVVAKLAQTILGHESKDWKWPTVPHSLVESYAADLAVDVKEEWKELQGTELTEGPDPMLEEFFLLHQTDQLRDLAKELGVFVSETDAKPLMVRKFVAAITGGNNRRLPLPKSVKPVGKKGGK